MYFAHVIFYQVFAFTFTLSVCVLLPYALLYLAAAASSFQILKFSEFSHGITFHSCFFCLLLLLVAITWTNAPENQYPILGEDYTVKCEVKADPNPTIDWLRNGDPVSSA